MRIGWLRGMLLAGLGACTGPAAQGHDAGMDAGAVDAGETLDGAHRDAAHPAADAARDADDADGENADGGDALDAAEADAASADAAVQLPDPISRADFCAELLERVCDWHTRCRGGGTSCESWPGRSNVAASCARLEADIAAGRVKFDGQAAALCVEAYDPVCGNRPVGAGPATVDLPPGCAEAFSGTLAHGAACHGETERWVGLFDQACADGYCDLDACPGTCRAFAQPGDSCTETVCDPATGYCLPDGMCAAYATLNEPCAASGHCAHGLQCVERDAGQGTVCLVPARPGEACEDAFRCEVGTLCVDGTCTLTSALGEPCMGNRNCPDGTLCTPEAGGDGSLCSELPNKGDPCPNLRCRDGLYCEPIEDAEPVCAVLPGLGEACPYSTCAPGTWCRSDDADTKLCAPLGGAGDDCLDYWGTGAIGAEVHCLDDLACIPSSGGTAGSVITAECGDAGTLQGDPCDSSAAATCAAGLFCSTVSSTCLPLGEAEGECNPSMPSCEAGLYCACDTESGACPGYTHYLYDGETCRAVKADGAKCFLASECASDHCVSNSCGEPVAQCAWPD